MQTIEDQIQTILGPAGVPISQQSRVTELDNIQMTWGFVRRKILDASDLINAPEEILALGVIKSTSVLWQTMLLHWVQPTCVDPELRRSILDQFVREVQPLVINGLKDIYRKKTVGVVVQHIDSAIERSGPGQPQTTKHTNLACALIIAGALGVDWAGIKGDKQ